MAEIQVSGGLYLQSLPNATLYMVSIPLLLSIPMDDPYPCQPEINEQVRSSNLQHESRYQSTFRNLQDEQILSDDGELFRFQLITRSHVRNLFTDEVELYQLKRRIIANHLIISDHKLPSYGPNGNYSCLNKTYVNQLVEAHYAHEHRRHQLLKMCQNKQLDPSIIDMIVLKNYLWRLKLDEKLTGYKFAIKSESQYYSLTITECIMTKKSTIVGIHIPLMAEGLDGMELKRVITPSFAYEGYSCSIKLQITDLAVVTTVKGVTIMIPQCDPMRDEVCYVTKYYDNSIFSILCAQHIITGATTEEITNLCSFQCVYTGEDNVFVFPISQTKFHITHANFVLQIKCPNKSYYIYHQENIGAIWVQIPCKCEIINGNETIVSVRLFCTEEVEEISYHQVIPAAFSNIRSIAIPAIHMQPPTFKAMGECLDRNWKWKVQSIGQVSGEVNTWKYIPMVLSILSILGIITIAIIFLLCKGRMFRAMFNCNQKSTSNSRCSSINRRVRNSDDNCGAMSKRQIDTIQWEEENQSTGYLVPVRPTGKMDVEMGVKPSMMSRKLPERPGAVTYDVPKEMVRLMSEGSGPEYIQVSDLK